MKKFLVLTAVVSLLVGVLVGAFLTLHTPTSTARASNQRVIHVVEHAITDTVQEFHTGTMSLGDILGFHNPVYDAADKHQVGTDNGQCTRTVATGKTEWECFWTVVLKQGQITGGTGAYQEAQGQMLLHARGNPVGSEYDFIYMLAN